MFLIQLFCHPRFLKFHTLSQRLLVLENTRAAGARPQSLINVSLDVLEVVYNLIEPPLLLPQGEA